MTMRVVSIALATACLAACGDSPRRAAPAGPDPIERTYPTSLPVADLVGAAACRDCHVEIYQRWRRSPHGRAMAEPTPETVLADFARDAEGFTFEQGRDGSLINGRRVDLVLASGRQHQIYLTREPGGAFALLPLIWSTWTSEWLPTSLYQGASLDPSTGGCFHCHLSQAYRRVTAAGAETAWRDLSINCESCHGPGREHVEHRRAGTPGGAYKNLQPLGKERDARLCGQCHGFSLKPYVFPLAADGLPEIFVTSLINSGLRADGTQFSTSYQYPGHVLSECFGQGALTCKGCHEPHGLTAQDFTGASAAGPDSNKQCTICHRSRIAPADVEAHSHHGPEIKCVNCHMAYSWIRDSRDRKQRTSDHSISIPRPRETIELGTPNACTTCHVGRSPEWALRELTLWGYERATVVRDWVKTIADARKITPGATARLLTLLANDRSGKYLRASALDLLVIQPADARVVPAVESYATGPDPELRAIAIRALLTHDPAGRARWQELGLSDPHPFVRMETFSYLEDPKALSPAAIERDLEDTLAYKRPPTDGLVHLVTVRHARGDLAEALELADLLARLATPAERDRLHLDTVRARIAAGLAGPARRP